MLVDFAPHLNNMVKQHATARVPEQRQPVVTGSEPFGNSQYRRMMNSVSPLESILNTIRSLNQASPATMQSLEAQDLIMESNAM